MPRLYIAKQRIATGSIDEQRHTIDYFGRGGIVGVGGGIAPLLFAFRIVRTKKPHTFDIWGFLFAFFVFIRQNLASLIQSLSGFLHTAA